MKEKEPQKVVPQEIEPNTDEIRDKGSDSNIIEELDSKSFFKQWLERLQQESWQLELIISGFALFGVYSSRGMISDLGIYMDNHSALRFVLILVSVGWNIFFFNLLVHVILRSLWIGAIGLRYVSGEIEYDELGYSEIFTRYLERKVGDYDDYIERLEKYCSVLFSYTFLLFLLFMSILLFILGFGLPVVIGQWLGLSEQNRNFFMAIWAFPYLLFGMIVFIDFITLGKIKKSKDPSVAKLYMPIYRLYSTITLSFLYRPLLYNFLDNRYTRRLFYFSIPYIFLMALSNQLFTLVPTPHLAKDTELVSQGLRIDPYYYDDLIYDQKNGLSPEDAKAYNRMGDVRLSAFYMKENYPYIFIKHKRRHKDVLNQEYDLPQVFEHGLQFTLFGMSEREDIAIDRIDSTYDARYLALDLPYRQLSDSIRQNLITSDLLAAAELRRDSLHQARDKQIIEMKDKINEHKQDRNERILRALQSMIKVEIDGIPYDEYLQCYFAKHPVSGYEGMMCNFPLDSLSQGHHKISVVTSNRMDEGEVETRDYTLPFIKTY